MFPAGDKDSAAHEGEWCAERADFYPVVPVIFWCAGASYVLAFCLSRSRVEKQRTGFVVVETSSAYREPLLFWFHLSLDSY